MKNHFLQEVSKHQPVENGHITLGEKIELTLLIKKMNSGQPEKISTSRQKNQFGKGRVKQGVEKSVKAG